MALWSNKDTAPVTGLVGIVGATYGTITNGTSVTAAASYNVTQKSATGGGTGGTFTIVKTGSGIAYSGFTTITGVLPINGGYTASTVVTISGAQLGGVDGTNDMTFNVNTLPTSALTGTTGTLGTIVTGTSVTAAATYTVTPKSVAGGGTGGTYTVVKTGSGIQYSGFTTVTVATPGTGYTTSSVVTVSGAQLGGVDVTNDMTFTVNVVPTAFNTELKAGSFIVISGVKYKIFKITSNIAAILTSLYEAATVSGGTITKHTAPTYLSLADGRNAVFVSQEEALLTTNKTKGLNGAGWWLYKEFIDSFGKSRYKTELIVSITTLEAVSGDSSATGEDLIVSDLPAVVTIGTQPTAQTTVSGGATFSVTATVAPSGTVTYQWQRALAATPTRFTNIVGATSASRAITGQVAGNNGDLYRVVVSSTPNGSVKVTSNAVVLTFGT